MEQFKESVHVAFSNLKINGARSLLSVLGIVIGIAAVIVVLSYSAAARKEILERVNAMGVNVMNISTNYDETTRRIGRMELEDVERIQRLPFVVSAFPNLNLYKDVRSRQSIAKGVVRGVDANYLTARQYRLSEGRAFSPIEVEQRSPVCLISAETRNALFANQDCIDRYLYVDETPLQIIGVFSAEQRRSNAPRLMPARKTRDAEVLVPLSTLLRTTQNVFINNIEVHVRNNYEGDAIAELREAMERSDPNRKGLYFVRDQRELAERRLEIESSLSLIGILVAGVSLIVGGIGMMNVMLTSVAERTREIGIRRAVGARRKDILFQFLIESCILSTIGGICGLVAGAAIARLIPFIYRKPDLLTPQLEPHFLFIAVFAGVLLGVIFGLYPATKASHLSPAEALRSE